MASSVNHGPSREVVPSVSSTPSYVSSQASSTTDVAKRIQGLSIELPIGQERGRDGKPIYLTIGGMVRRLESLKL